MAPSRGSSKPLSPPPKPGSQGDVAIQQQGDSAFNAAKRNFNYLINPAAATDRPGRFRTRALLRTVRYISVFVFWRLVRWAKYAAIGFLTAAIGATAFGSAITGVAWIAAPTTLGASIVAGSIWGVGRIGARILHRRWERTGKDVGQEQREQIEDGSPVKAEGTWRQETGPGAIPW